MDISVAIPCYNCAPQISRLLRELNSILSQTPEIKKVFIIDNQSSDETLHRAEQCVKDLTMGSRFSIHLNPQNYGLGGSHKVAFELALQYKMSHLIFFHGDHQATAFDIPHLIKSSRKSFGCTILGARFARLSKLEGYSYVRKIGNRFLNRVYSLCTGKRIYDLGSGLNLFEMQYFCNREYQKFSNGFTFNMDLLLYLIRKKINFAYEPINWSTTDQITNVSALRVGFKTLQALLFWLLRIPLASEACCETRQIL